jgi:predicted O-methyltransferase YrrM
MSEYTQDWFTRHLPVWNPLVATVKPKKILEIGSFEGRSTCFMIENATVYNDDIEIHCVDTWLGSKEHGDTDFKQVEARFDANVKESLDKVTDRNVRVIKHKGTSLEQFSKLVVEGHLSSFDWVLVDGSHLAVDVLYDAIFAFKLTRLGGVIIFDDYNVQEAPDLENNLDFPKIAIKSFGKIYGHKVSLVRLINENTGKPLTDSDTYQLYLTKISE